MKPITVEQFRTINQKQLFCKPRQCKIKAKGKTTEAMQRSLAFLERGGFMAAKCEQFKPWIDRSDPDHPVYKGGHKVDLFGFMDILAFDGRETLAVQTTDHSHIGAHLTQYRANEEVSRAVRKWLALPGRRLVIHGWRPLVLPTKTGGTKVRWELTERDVKIEDFTEER